jgi:hypothetical protein
LKASRQIENQTHKLAGIVHHGLQPTNSARNVRAVRQQLGNVILDDRDRAGNTIGSCEQIQTVVKHSGSRHWWWGTHTTLKERQLVVQTDDEFRKNSPSRHLEVSGKPNLETENEHRLNNLGPFRNDESKRVDVIQQ